MECELFLYYPDSEYHKTFMTISEICEKKLSAVWIYVYLQAATVAAGVMRAMLRCSEKSKATLYI